MPNSEDVVRGSLDTVGRPSIEENTEGLSLILETPDDGNVVSPDRARPRKPSRFEKGIALRISFGTPSTSEFQPG